MAKETKETHPSSPIRIAFINDDVDFVEIRNEALEANGYQVDHFPDFETLFQHFERNPDSIRGYDLFLADYALADDPLSKIRGELGTRMIIELWSNAKVLGLSGRRRSETSFIENGAIGFVCRQDGRTAMLETIAEALSG